MHACSSGNSQSFGVGVSFAAMLLLSWAVLLLSVTTQALNVSLRLSGGPGPYAGRVEVNYNATWGSVCDDGLDMNVGHVICKQLGYPEAIAVPCCNAFGAGSGPFWLAGVGCQGNESNLAECNHKNWGDNNCNHHLDAASVVCRALNISVSYPLPLRMSYASVPYAGCVEVKYAGVWGDVGRYHWDRKNGGVVCRQLGYRDVVTVLFNCRVILEGKYNAVTWMDDVRCHGNESSLTNCSHEWQTYRSTWGYDAGVVCRNETETGLNISLNGASVVYAGRVEVRLAGKWGTIDRFSWDLRDANVTCRQLGFPAAELAIRGATYIFGPKGSSMGLNIQWIENVQCLGTESLLYECPHNVSFTPGPKLDAGVVCKSNNLERRIRLAGGDAPSAGRVEVYIAGVWGTVRNEGWNNAASHVTCRELGYQNATSTILSSVGTFGKGEGPVWMSGLDCKGHEDSLWECSWSKVAGIYWDHDNDVGLVCGTVNETEPSKSRRTLILALSITAAVILLIVVLVFVFYFRFYHKRRGQDDTGTDFMHMSEASSPTDVGMPNPGFKDTEATFQENSNNEIDWSEIARERISLGEKIGAELVGVTFHGRLSLENGTIAGCIVKTANDDSTDESVCSEDENDLLNELKTMSCLGSHLNILNLFGACTIKGPVYLIFEDAEHGNLLDYLQQNQMQDENNSIQTVCTLSKVEKLRIALDVSRGMKYIAEKKCIHKDLAARNVRLTKNNVAKITNIGSSRKINDETFNDKISTDNLSRSKWMAPGILESLHFSSQSDVWSFGILLWEIETGGAVPYSDIQAKDLLETLKSGHRMEKPAKCSDAVYDVMCKCWQTLPSERPKFSELCIVLDTLVTRETSC